MKLVKESLEEILNEEETLTEITKISDIIKSLKGDECFAIISAYQKDKTNEENSKNTEELLNILNKTSPNVIPLTGEWDENIPEKSFFALKPDNKSCDEFKNEMKELAKKYNQESILYSLEGDIVIIYTNGKVDDIGDDLNVTKTYVGFKFE